MTDEESRLRLLRDSLAVLALPPDEQIRAEFPGCAVCDILNDLDNAITCVTENDPSLPVARRNALDCIMKRMGTMDRADLDCDAIEPAVLLRRQDWVELRTLAVTALSEFGWEGVRVPQPVEVKPGMWHRDLAE